MRWWNLHFDELYLRMFSTILTPQRTAEEVDGLRSMLALRPGQRVLDLCCGQGRHAVPLAAEGYRVTGLDLSRYLLSRAQQTAQREGVDIEWVRVDMRWMPWCERFDACLNLFTAFGYFEDEAENQQVLHQVHRALKPGGQFLIDVSNRDYYLLHLWPQAWRRVGDAIILEEADFDPITSRFTMTYTWMEGGGEESLIHSVRHYTAPELMAMLREAKLTPTALYGDYDASEFDLDSRRLIIVARKEGIKDG